MFDIISCGIDRRSVTFFMDTTANMHMNTGSVAELHNWRDIDLILAENKKNKDSLIDIENEHGDSFHESLCRCTLKSIFIDNQVY